MCGSKGSTVSSTSGPPQEFLKAYSDVYGQASGLTQQPYQAYGGPMIAGFSPDQLAAFGTIQNSQGLAQPYFNQAASYYQNAAQPITPMGFDNVDLLPSLGLSYFDWAGQQAGQAAAPISLMDYDISPYQNQYTSDVTNSLSDLYAQNNAEQFSQLRGNAASQGAFGGDRDAILTAETARQQKLAQDPTLAQIQQQGFAQAQEEFNKQQLADYQRQVAQKQYALGAGQLGMGIGSGLWGEYNTQQAQNTQAQEASAYLQNYAGTNFANLGMQAQNSALQGAQAQLGIGAQQQQMAQQQLNVPYYQFMQQQAYPYQQLGWLSNIATGLGGASGGNSSTTYPGPSTIGQIAGLGTAGLGAYGLYNSMSGSGSGGYGYGSSPNYSGQGGDFWDLTGMSGWGGADGGAVPHRAPGGSVELGVPPEFGGSGIPGMESYIPGAHGLGSEPASKEGSGLSKMFMQPVTTQTQQQSGGGGLGQILGLGMSAAKLFLDDGGAVPRGTGLDGYAEGGMPIHSAAPILSDLTHVMAPSDGPKPTEESLMPRINYAPSFDAQGYPGALTGIPRGTAVPPPLSIPMSHGVMNRAALGAPPPMLPSMGPGQDFGLSMPPPPTFPPEWGQTSEGNADGGGVGYANGGSALPGLAGYIPAAPQFGNGMGPPKPPSMQGWKPENGNDSIMSLLTSAKSFLGELNKESAALGGAVEPTSTPLQFDEGGAVSGMMGGMGSVGGSMAGGGMQQRALLQQYQNMPTEKLREMAMRYPPTTPQGAALQRALQMRQMNPASGAPSTATGPTGPYGPSGQVTPGTTAARGGGMGLGGSYDESLMGELPGPVSNSIMLRPSYGEGEMIPYQVDERDAAFGPEAEARFQSRMGAGREEKLLRALSRRNGERGLAEGGPVPITPQSGDFNIQRILDEMRAQGTSMQVGDAASASDRMRRELQRRIHPGFDGGGGIKDDDWIEPPPRDWVPPLIIEPPPKPSRPKDERYYGGLAGFAEGGVPDDSAGLAAGLEPVKDAWMTFDPLVGAIDLRPKPPNFSIVTRDMPQEAARTSEPYRKPPVNNAFRPADEDYGAGFGMEGLGKRPAVEASPIPEVGPDRTVSMPQITSKPGGTNGIVPIGTPSSSSGRIVNGIQQPLSEADYQQRYGSGAQPNTSTAAPEDVLYQRVRRAEGTAGGNGFVVYGGGAFTPGAEHPGDAALRYGPDGRETHAAGPGQWQPGTWNGLKPVFRAKFGRDPVFSDDADQKGMVWLNAAKIYPGGEDKMRADIAAGTLNTRALAPQWAGFNASDGTSGGTTTYASGISPGYRATVGRAGPPDQLVGPGTGQPGIGAPAAGLAATPASYSSPLREKEKSDLQKMMSSPWMALIGAGAGMMASRSPFPGVAIGEGLQTGLKLAGSMADRENKEDLTQLRSQSIDNQSKHLADMAKNAQERAQETTINHQALRARDNEALDLKRQQAAQAEANAAANLELKTRLATSQEEARQAKVEYDRQIVEIRKNLADTTAARQRAEENKAEPRFGPGPDPNDPSKQVQGTWFYPKSPDPNAENGGVRFVPYVGTAKESGAGAGGAGGRKAMFDDLIKNGLATDYIDAEKKVAEARRNPDTFKKSYMYSRLLATALHEIGQGAGMALSEPQKDRLAKKKVEEWMGLGAAAAGAPAAPAGGAPAAAPAPSAAPAAALPPKPPDQATATAAAKAAIAAGAPRDGVLQNMQQWGYSPAGL